VDWKPGTISYRSFRIRYPWSVSITPRSSNLGGVDPFERPAMKDHIIDEVLPEASASGQPLLRAGGAWQFRKPLIEVLTQLEAHDVRRFERLGKNCRQVVRAALCLDYGSPNQEEHGESNGFHGQSTPYYFAR
jgi:hypothetical protein